MKRLGEFLLRGLALVLALAILVTLLVFSLVAFAVVATAGAAALRVRLVEGAPPTRGGGDVPDAGGKRPLRYRDLE